MYRRITAVTSIIKRCVRSRHPPYSTFKIISALMGLHNGVIADETSAMEYNGTQYYNSAWNKDLSLREAFQTSCIWYSRQVIDAVGSAEVKKGTGRTAVWQL